MDPVSLPQLTLDDVVERHPDCVWRRIDDEVVLLQPDSGQVRVANEVGGAIWERLDGHSTARQVVGGAVAVYDVDLETALAEGLAFLVELGACGLVRPVVAVLAR